MTRIVGPRTLRDAMTARMTRVEEAWITEAERRFSEWRRGKRVGIPGDRALKQIRRDLGW